jgi:hypothetical protein
MILPLTDAFKNWRQQIRDPKPETYIGARILAAQTHRRQQFFARWLKKARALSGVE